jgi:adenylate kinase family enzyme
MIGMTSILPVSNEPDWLRDARLLQELREWAPAMTREPLQLPPRLQRIAIVGVGGAGKSTLARRVATITGLPLVHLDREFWGPSWAKPTNEAWDARHAQLIARERWICDGNYGRTIAAPAARADLVVELLVPTRVALARVIRRTIATRGADRADLAPDCREGLFRRGTFEFWWYVVTYARRHADEDARRIRSSANGAVVTLRSRRDVDAFLSELAARR